MGPQPDFGPRDAARWMLAEVGRAGMLDHVVAVEHLLAVAPHLIKWNREGQAMVRTSVLRAFRRIRGLDIVWDHEEYRWRPRTPEDPPKNRYWRR